MGFLMPQIFKKVLHASTCAPAFELYLPSEVVAQSLAQLMEFELQEGGTQKCWRVSLKPLWSNVRLEYCLLGWQSVCEQSQLRVGDEVHFFVYDAHMVFSLAHRAGLAGASPTPAILYSPGPASKQHESSSSEERLFHDEMQLQRLKGASALQPILDALVSKTPGLPAQPPSRPSSFAPPLRTRKFGEPPGYGFRSNAHGTLHQVLNFSMGLGSEGLLEAKDKEPMLQSTMMSSSLPQEDKLPTMMPAVDAVSGDANDILFDLPASAPVPQQSSLNMEVELGANLTSNCSSMSRRSDNEATMSWVQQRAVQDSKPGQALKRRCEHRESPWQDAFSAESFPFIEGFRSQKTSPRLSSTNIAHARGLPGTPVQGSSAYEEQENVVQGSILLEMRKENTFLKRALLQESARADRAEKDCLQLFQTMKAAEVVVKRQTSLGMDGIGKMYNVTNRLASAEMLHHLHHLDLPNAQALGAVQVQLKHQANVVLEALVQMQALAGCQITAPPKIEDMECTPIPHSLPPHQSSS